jgi:predicted CopG family antitoxin
MTDRTTINVSKEAHRKAQKAKEDGETWSDYLLRSTDQDAVVTETGDIDSEEIMHKLEQIEGAQADTVSEALQLADIGLADLQDDIRKVQEMAEQARDNTDEIKEVIR